jgi:hypothetical protein
VVQGASGTAMIFRTIFLAFLLLITFVVGVAALYGGAALYRQVPSRTASL